MQIVTSETMDEYEEQFAMARSAELPETPAQAASSSSSSSSAAEPAAPVAPEEAAQPTETPARRGRGRPKSSTPASAAKATEDTLDDALPSDQAVEEDPVDPEEIDGEGLPDQPALEGSDPFKFHAGDGTSPDLFTHIPVATREYRVNRFIDFPPGELVEYMLKEAHEDIIVFTNRNAAEVGAKKTDYPEIMDFLGCLFQMTTVKLPKMRDYWYPTQGMRDQGWGVPDFASKMSYERFVELRQLLKFAVMIIYLLGLHWEAQRGDVAKTAILDFEETVAVANHNFMASGSTGRQTSIALLALSLYTMIVTKPSTPRYRKWVR